MDGGEAITNQLQSSFVTMSRPAGTASPAQPAECGVLPILFSRQSAIHRAAARTLLPRRAQHHITSAALQEAGARVQECGHRQGEINAVLVHGNQCPVVTTPACTPPLVYQQQHHSSSSSSEAPNPDHECTLLCTHRGYFGN